MLIAWSRAARPREPRQDRKVAAVSESPRVPWERRARVGTDIYALSSWRHGVARSYFSTPQLDRYRKAGMLAELLDRYRAPSTGWIRQ